MIPYEARSKTHYEARSKSAYNALSKTPYEERSHFTHCRYYKHEI